MEVAPGPPDLIGHVGAMYLKGTPPGFRGCATNPFTTDPSRAGYLEIAMLHEIMHTMGFVPVCAPQEVLSGHVGDDPGDLMYAGDQPWRPTEIDADHLDYFRHGRADCLDLDKSVFLTPTDPAATPPPGW